MKVVTQVYSHVIDNEMNQITQHFNKLKELFLYLQLFYTIFISIHF